MKFKYAILGLDMNKIDEKGFEGSGGGWDLYKCFYREDDSYGEFYLNVNTVDGEGEIVLKDIDYGDVLLDALKKTLKPEEGETKKTELVNWNKLTEILERLGENKSKNISRHAKGLIKALKL